MVFQLGKNKTADDENVRQETFRRWREASQRHQAGVQAENIETTGEQTAAPQETQLELNVNTDPPPIPPTPASESHSAVSHSAVSHSAVSRSAVSRSTASLNPNVEEIKMDSMRAVEWPDPRSTITLTQPITLTQEVPPEPLPISRTTPLEPQRSGNDLQRSATAKLAHFVSTGLTATGLLAAKSTVPQKSKVDVIRTVADTPLEIERRPNASLAPIAAQTSAATPAASASSSESSPDLNDDIKRRFGTNIRSALGPGTIIEGTFSFDSPVSIEGTLIGEVRSNSVLIVGAQASVNASVKVGSLIVFGTVRGDVESTGLVEVKEGGLLEGDVVSERFAMDDGAWFQGRCTPTASPKRARSAVEADQVLVGDSLLGENESSLPIQKSVTDSDSWSIE